MESSKNRKRKSPKSNQIFEVSEKDLSPDCSEEESAEPNAKILKTQASDVSKSRNSSGGNLKIEEKLAAIKKSFRKSAQKNEDSIESVEHVEAKHLPQVDEGVQTPTKSPVKKLKPKRVLKSAKKKQKKGIPAKKNKKALDDEITDSDIICSTEVQDVHAKADTSIVEAPDCTLEDGEVSDSTQDKIDSVEDTAKSSYLDSNPIDKPDILISFKNALIADIYKEKLLRYLERFVELEILTPDETTMHINVDPALDPQQWHVVDVQCITEEVEKVSKSPSSNLKLDLTLCENTEVSNKKKKKKDEKKKKQKNKKNKDLFIVDATPTPEVQANQNPQYFTKFLINDNKDTEVEDSSKPASNAACFNCGKNHALKDCPDPKNMGKIYANRQKFMVNKTKSTTRYHVDEQQYGHLVPGKISSALRKALGLRHNQIPSIFYRMRTAGYPPGWLEEARIEQSNLAMFDIHGNDVKNANSKTLRGLDPDKIIDYPGFNVPFEKGTKDEYKTYRVPPYSEDLHKGKMIEFFERQFSKELDDFKTQDMEIEAVVETESEIVPAIENEENLTLRDLEKEKEMLLNKLVNDDSNSRSSEGQKIDSDQEKPGDVVIDLVEDDETSQEEVRRDAVIDLAEDCEITVEIDPVNNSGTVDCQEENIVNEEKPEVSLADQEVDVKTLDLTGTDKTCESTSSTPTSKKIKDSTFGTPILKSASPYSTLPNQDNFSRDISPIINFENLPNSTGKYEKITGVLQKVRNTLKHLSHCKS